MSFRLKTILGIAFIEIILLIILVFSSIEFLSDSNNNQLKQLAQATTRLYASAAKDALLAMDLASLESITEEVVQNPGVVYARIRNQQGVLAQSGEQGILSRPFHADHSLDTIDDDSFDSFAVVEAGGYQFGRVEIGLSTHPLQLLMSQAKRWAIGIASLEVILVALFSFIFGTYLTRRLSLLKQAAAKIRQNGPGLQLPVAGEDELAEVVSEFNQMSLSLSASYQALRLSTKEYQALAERAQQNEAMNQAILAVSLDGLISIDQDGTIVEINPIAAEMLGWQTHEVVGRDMVDTIVPPAFRQAHQQGMKNYFETGEGPVLGKRLELEALHRNGTMVPIEIAISPIRIGGATLFTAFIRDLSEQKRAEQELSLAAQAFETIEPMFITNANGEILRTNGAFSEVTGYSAEEVKGLNPRVLSSGRHDTAFFQDLWQQLIKEGVWSGEIYNKRKNGEIYPERLTISAVVDASGSTTHYIAHFVDISEQKNNEQVLEVARQQAEQASEAKSRFLATMSHEIRSPLNAVITMSSLLLESNLAQRELRYAEMINQGGETLLALINDILDFSKIESNHLELQLAKFDLIKLCHSGVALLTEQALQKGIKISLSVEKGIASSYLGDELRIRQVLTNLLSNAIKFTDQGYVDVRLMAQGASGVVLEVEDSGIGIAPEKLPSIFSEFVQVESDERRRFGGTGLGLAITKQLVEKMGGTITCSSQLGVGSCFGVCLPLSTGSPQEPSQKQESAAYSEAALTLQAGEGKKILLVEDNLMNQEIAQALLEQQQLVVEIANNGEEAVALAEVTRFDLILMDLAMPIMGGIEATQQIRTSSNRNRQTPILAMTANAFVEDKQRCFEAGMDDYISKPLDIALFKEKLRLWLEPSKQQLSSPAQPHQTTTPATPAQASLTESHSLANQDVADSLVIQEHLVKQQTLEQLSHDLSPAVLLSVLNLFVEESEARVSQLLQAIAEQDWSTLESLAHQLKSSSGSVGAEQLAEKARLIEVAGRNHQLEDAKSAGSGLMALYQSSAKEIREFIAGRADEHTATIPS